ncbi:MAG: UbiD family decarboxylase [Deltaproteobacteria bacterium]|nr:UbiD family decarboxylase [Deltaproteobacteria bacterium]
MAFKDMREYLALLERDGQLKRTDIPLQAGRDNKDMAALMRHLHNDNNIALILNNLKGYNTPEVPLVFNPFGTRERTAMTIGLRDPLEAKAEHARVLADKATWIEPRLIDQAGAPCKDVIIKGDDIRLDQQIPHVWFGKEGPAYITNGVGITKDPETGKRNVGWYRTALMWDAFHPLGGTYPEGYDQRYMAVYAYWNPPMNQIGNHLFKASQLGKPLEIAFACSCDPSVHLAAATGLPYGEDEYAFAGGLRGEAVELVKCETVDLEVPATAEYVIEGELYYDDQVDIGWHSNVAGYYDKVHTIPVMKVNCITHRKKPLWHATLEMVPPFDHNYIGMIPVEGELLADLQRKIPEVKDVVVTPSMLYIVQLSVDGADKPHAEFGKYIIQAVWGASGRWARTAKIIVVVGPDVDPYDLTSVEWAIMTRVQPVSDTIMNPHGQAFVDDPSAPITAAGFPAVSEQMGIDATIKVPERFNEYREVSQADPEEVARIAELLKSVLG